MSRERTRVAGGFTLLELLIAVGIMMLLAALLFPVLNKVKEKARTVFCLNNLRQIYIPVRSYVLDNNGSFPPFVYYRTTASENTIVNISAQDNRIMLTGSYPEPEIFLCPSDSGAQGIKVYNDEGDEIKVFMSYSFNLTLVMSDVKMSRVEDQSGVALVFDARTKSVQGQWRGDADWYEGVIRKRHDNRLNILFVDGHAKTMTDTTDEMFAY